ncbi:MAG: hypothetical protein ABI183_07605 [Polyangiaceae bacterium]
MRTRLCFAACFVLSGAAACSSSSSQSLGAPVSDGGAGDAQGSNVEPITFNVFEDESPATPIAGALVSLDYNDGTDELQTSDVTGKVTFVSSSIASGVTVVSGGTTGRIITTVIAPNVAAYESKGLKLTLRTSTAFPSANLTGAISDKLIAGDLLGISTTSYGSYQDNTAATYTLSVLTGQPFTLVGLEHSANVVTGQNSALTVRQWFHIDHPALTAAATLDLDVGTQTPDTPSTISGTITIPPNAGTFATDCKAALVLYGADAESLSFTPQIGVATSTTLSADKGSFAYTANYITLPNVSPYAIAELYTSDGATSQEIYEGVPANGLVVSDLIAPIKLSSSGIAAGDPIDATAYTDPVFLVGLQGTDGAWTVVLPPGKMATVPHLRAELKALLGTTKVTGFVQLCRYFDDDAGHNNFCRNEMTSRNLVITP